MLQIKELLKNKKRTFLIVGIFLFIVVLILYLFLLNGQNPLIPGPVVVNNSVPPVVIHAPELMLTKVTPSAGNRETFDTFSQTFFEFSSDLDEVSASVNVTPNILIGARVYKEEPRVLVIEPTKTPWSDGVEYTITINQGLRGLGGEELKQKVEYKFSNKQPAVFEGGDPIPVK